MTDLDRAAPSALEHGVPFWEYAEAPESREIVRLQDRYSPYEMTALMEFKTVWHPMGA